jgi:hypothetical protein
MAMALPLAANQSTIAVELYATPIHLQEIALHLLAL